MKKILRVPFLGANDSDCLLVSWEVNSGENVNKNQRVCTLETTKSVFDVQTECDGYLYLIAKELSTLKVNDVLGIIYDGPVGLEQVDNDFREVMEKSKTDLNDIRNAISKKAELLVNKNNLNLNKVLEFANGQKITEQVVLDYLNLSVSFSFQKGFSNLERVGVIGGVSGGGALIVIDSIIRNPNQQAICVFDQDMSLIGKSILGVPIVGTLDSLDLWLKENRLDSVIIAFNKNLSERTQVFNALLAKGVNFTNVIDPSVEIRSKVKFGIGNVILSKSYIGACTIIGNNNFISSNTCLEHGNILGDGCAFGPGVTTSGNVSIGAAVRFGTGIFVEPNLKIGDFSIIASGSIITSDVSEGYTVRHKQDLVLKD